MKEGFYWVKTVLGQWTIGQRLGESWRLIGDEESAYDDDFQYIGARINAPEEVLWDIGRSK